MESTAFRQAHITAFTQRLVTVYPLSRNKPFQPGPSSKTRNQVGALTKHPKGQTDQTYEFWLGASQLQDGGRILDQAFFEVFLPILISFLFRAVGPSSFF